MYERASTPYSCHGVFTDQSIFSLNLPRIQTSQEPQWPITNTDLILTDVIISPEDYVEMFTWGRHFFSLTDARSFRPELTYFAGKEAYLKIDLSVEIDIGLVWELHTHSDGL